MLFGNKTFRLISTLAWLIVFFIIVLIAVGINHNTYTDQAAEMADDAMEYACEAAENELRCREENNGPPWPAHGIGEYKAVYVKSADYTVNGRNVRYTFVMYIQQWATEGIIDSDYYTVTVKSDNGVFSLESVDVIEEEQTSPEFTGECS